jgi:dethiobiotin synthetase
MSAPTADLGRPPGGGAVFVTGTDTDAGKTVITAALAAALRAAGAPITAAKALATGSPPPGDDAERLGRAAGHPPRCARCLPTPASPARAALLAGEDIDVTALLAWCAALPRPALLEGVGGFEVPIAPTLRVSGLARALGWPVLVVAQNRLGAVNHSLLTAQAVQAQGLTLAGLVLVDPPGPPGPLQAWNADDLAAALPCPVARAPRLPDPDDPAALAALGAALLAQLPAVTKGLSASTVEGPTPRARTRASTSA